MSNTRTKKTIILIITLLVSISLIISGICIAISNSVKNSFVTLRVDQYWTKTTTNGNLYKFKFSPTSSKTYYIGLNEFSLYSFRDSDNEMVDRSLETSYNYDKYYEAYLYKNETYTIIVKATSSSVAGIKITY